MPAVTVSAPAVRIEWDEPSDCTSPRGWAGLVSGHPDADACDRGSVSRCCGFYLDYLDSPSVPAATPVLASAYLHRLGTGERVRTEPIGNSWHADAESARRWVEQTVTARLTR